MSKSEPIRFDQHASGHVESWPETYREMRSACPRAWSSDHGGFWVATRYHDIVTIAQRLEDISAHQGVHPDTGKMMLGTAIPGIPGTRSVPNETDSPEWDGVRSFLNSWFSPKTVEKRRPRARRIAAALVDNVIETGRCDLVDDIASPLPGIMTTEIFGFPWQEWKLFAEPIHALVATRADDAAFGKAAADLAIFRRRVDEEVARRRVEPRDDFLTHLACGTINGKRLDHRLLQDIAWQILSGGVDTTAAVTANALVYLGRHHEQRQELIARPDLLPGACEEFIRYFTPIHAAGRTVKHDAVIDGWPLEEGDRILLAYASGNRDPAVFVKPDELMLDRAPNRHLGFGAGQHRCLGAFLGRMMFQELLTEFLRRIPDYRVVDEEVEPYASIGFVNGLVHAPIVFEPGPRKGESHR